MLKTILSNLGKYKKAAILSPVFTLLEVVIDVLLPIVISFLIDILSFKEPVYIIFRSLIILHHLPVTPHNLIPSDRRFPAN